MDKIEEQSAYGCEPMWMKDLDVSGGVSGGQKLATVARRQAIKIVHDLDDRTKEIGLDPDLTEAGKAKVLSRAVKDAESTLGQVRKHQDALARELSQLLASYRPAGGEPSDAINAAIWPKLPTTSLEMTVTYRNAIARGDWATANAVEALPGVFGGALSADELVELRRERMCAESADAYACMIIAEDALEVVERAASMTARHLLDAAKDLPEPDPETGGTIGSDGLLVLSPSQADEARA